MWLTVIQPFLLLASVVGCGCAESILSSKVFVMSIVHTDFNWSSPLSRSGYLFRPTFAGSPDLPQWLDYVYYERKRTGYLFGVPPNNEKIYDIEIVAVDRDNYQTMRKTIQLNVTEKQEIAKYEVNLKIDNQNVYDMFEGNRIEKLLNIFREVLWPQSRADIYLTFIISAVKYGARLPLKPNESDGVVLRLGSREPFSKELLLLQAEVKPLSKLSYCPRDFKKTSVDRHFRALGLLLDWCSFKLISNTDLNKDFHPDVVSEPIDWRLPVLSEVPSRSYTNDFLTTILLPLTVLFLMALLLSLILCFHHKSLSDLSSDEFFESIFYCETCRRGKNENDENCETLIQYEAVQRATSTLRSMSNNRETSCQKSAVPERKEAGRPSPPPYGTTRRILNVDS